MGIKETLISKIKQLLKFLHFIMCRFFALVYDYGVSYPVTIRIYKYLLREKFLVDFP